MSKRYPNGAFFASIDQVSLEIMAERDKTEREIIELLRQGKDREALRRLRIFWNIEPRLKVVK